MKLATRAAALGLSALLLLPTGALAAENSPAQPLTAAQRQEDLDLLYTTLKEGHPNLFAENPEDVFLEKKAEIEARLDTVSDLEFTFDLQSLTALAGDSHTGVTLSDGEGMRFFPMALTWYEGGWILSTVDAGNKSALGKTVTALNGDTMDQVLARFATFISADNEVKLRRQARQLLYAENILSYLDLAEAGEALVLTLRDGVGEESTLSLEALSTEELGAAELAKLSASVPEKPATAYVKGKYYFSLPLNEDTYYIQYNVCQEDPELPMETFAAQVKEELEAGGYGRVLLDLRNNGGGSDGVIAPLLNLLAPAVREGELELMGLIGETTFSSAIINAVMIQEMGGVLAGSLTSGSVDHFGSTDSFTLPNSGLRVRCSSKMIALSGLLEAAQGYGVEPLRPDVAVEQTLSDSLAGKDTLVDALLAHPDVYEVPERSETLTRGRFLTLLWEQAKERGADTAAPENEFYDVMPFAYYAPAVDWAAEAGITLGDDEGAFEAARPITRTEAAVMLCRFADGLGLALPEREQAAGFPDEAQIPSWGLEAARRVGRAGLMETADGTFSPDGTFSVAEGRALVDALAEK